MLAGHHRLRRGQPAAQRRQPGRAGRAAGHPRLPPQPGRRPARTVCLIPSSAHGTNAASAVMAGLEVVVVACDDDGNVDLDRPAGQGRRGRRPPGRGHGHLPVDPRRVRGGHRRAVRRSSTTHGGQVYVDGANLNALVGVAQPGRFGADVSHLNLHKTFCIPHGGGGPGVGPVGGAGPPGAVPARPPARAVAGRRAVGPVAAAPFGSAGILPISWVYIALMGADGLLRRDRQVAIASANYVARAPPATTTPSSTPGAGRLRRPRVHPRPAPDHEGHRRHRRRRRQAADRLRLPRADHELPGGGHADGRADGERGPPRARPVLRRHDRHQGRDRPRGRRRVGRPRPARSATPPTRPRTSSPTTWDRAYPRELGGVPGRRAPGHQVLPAGRPHRRRRRRPQPRLLVPPDRGVATTAGRRC